MNRKPLQLLRAVEIAKQESPRTWKQRSALTAYQDWWNAGAPQLIYKDTLTNETYLNPHEIWRLSDVMHPSYSAGQLMKAKHPQLTDIFNAECHQEQDVAGSFGKELLNSISPEDTEWSLLDHFEPDYDWHFENAGLARDDVNELWRFMSVQLCQSIARSVSGGNARGMFVLISNGGQGKSTFVDAISNVSRKFVFDAFEAKGISVPRHVNVTFTDNMAGSVPDKWVLGRMFINSVCTYLTEKASYLNDNSTLELFKAVTAGAELDFRYMHSTRTQRGRQRATVFLDFNPSMVNTLLSGKLAEDVETARRFMCFYIKGPNPKAWENSPSGGHLKLAQDAQARERFWKYVKYCDERQDIVHGVLSEDVRVNFEKLIKGLAARSATSNVSTVRSQLQEVTQLVVNKDYLQSIGIDYRDINRVGYSAICDLMFIPRDANNRFSLTLGGNQFKFKSTDYIVLKEGWDTSRVKSSIIDLFRKSSIDASRKEDVRTWLEGIQWQELDTGWRLVAEQSGRPYMALVAG